MFRIKVIFTKGRMEKSYTYGETVQGNYNPKDNYGKYQRADGKFGIKEASITIYAGTIADDAKTSNPNHAGLDMEQAIGAVAGLEIVHATDEVEINKDISVEQTGTKAEKEARKVSREIAPNSVEQKIINQSTKSTE
jgi:hypothetical protein